MTTPLRFYAGAFLLAFAAPALAETYTATWEQADPDPVELTLPTAPFNLTLVASQNLSTGASHRVAAR